jgi:DMSO/TMAO reductase YedYZ molybdopterin-dependent catalytic subunit
MPGKRRFHAVPAAAAAGLVSAATLLAVAELIALVIARQASPLLAVGAFVIDIVPRPLKEFAITTFGDSDKLVLLLSVGLAAVIGAALAGVLQLIRPPFGAVLLALAGVAAVAATATRAGGIPVLAAIPSALGTIAGVFALILLVRRLRAWRDASAAPAEDRALARRGFLRLSLITGASAVVVGIGARVANAALSSGTALREALNLPAPGTKVDIPDGAELDIDGLSPLITANKDFYRVDTALTVPSVDSATWSLKVTGMVEKEITLDFDDLLAMGVDEYGITMTCVSNEVGGGLLGNAIWLGVPVRDILAMASPKSGADMILSRSVDGYTASTPLSALTDENLDAILAVGMNGEPLPLEHGFPVRMVVPGLYGYVSATKWLTELKVTTFDADEAYWTPRGYSEEAPIKLSSRIDTPRVDKAVPAGQVAIAGMAWAQPVGVAKVEVQIDDGDWQEATLSTAINDTSWVQWFLDWSATSGTHYVAVRATDKAGTVQTEERAAIAPNGSSGLQRTLVRVS